MGRKTQVVVVEQEGRDFGKAFLLTEMPASRAEKWAVRAFLALAHGGVEIPEDIAQAGLAGIASVSLQALGSVPFAEAEPLLDEMMGCVQCMPDRNRPDVLRPLVETDTEEVATRLHLRKEVFSLHTGFSFPAADSTSTSKATG